MQVRTVEPAKKNSRLTKPLLLAAAGLEELAALTHELQASPPAELEAPTQEFDDSLQEQGCHLEMSPTSEPRPPTTVQEKLRRNLFYIFKTYQTRHSAVYEYGTLCFRGVQTIITIEKPLEGVPPAVELDREVHSQRKMPNGGLYFFLPAQIQEFMQQDLSHR